MPPLTTMNKNFAKNKKNFKIFYNASIENKDRKGSV